MPRRAARGPFGGDLSSRLHEKGGTSPPGRRGLQTGEDALDQLEGVSSAQDDARSGKSSKLIDSIEKSKQRLQASLDRIKTLEDAEREFPREKEDKESEERDQE